MKSSESPLSFLDLSTTRRTVVILFFAALAFSIFAFFSDFNQAYEAHSALRNFLAGFTALLGTCLALLELRHSGEANEYRAEQIRLTEVANKYREESNEHRKEANRLNTDNLKLQHETLELNLRIFELKEGVEKKLTKVRLYVRVHLDKDGPHLFVSNLSDFDLWINKVELNVTEVVNAQPGTKIIGGAKRISRGKTDDGYLLFGILIQMSGNVSERMNVKFHIKVSASGVQDEPVEVDSPFYHYLAERGKTPQLLTLR